VRELRAAGQLAEAVRLVGQLGPYRVAHGPDGTTSLGAAVLEAYGDQHPADRSLPHEGARQIWRHPGHRKAWPSGWRPGTYRPADLPLMTERIEDPAQTPAVLVGHLGCRNGTGLYCLGKHRVRIINNKQNPAGRAADRPWAEPWSVRSARRNPERGVSDRQLRDDLIAFANLMKDSRTKSYLVERNGRGSAIDP
jgi:hypothetical protein